MEKERENKVDAKSNKKQPYFDFIICVGIAILGLYLFFNHNKKIHFSLDVALFSGVVYILFFSSLQINIIRDIRKILIKKEK